MPLGTIVRRALFYTGIAIAVLLLIAAAVLLSIRTGISIPRQWIALAIFTVALLFAMIRAYQRYWKRLGFWLALGGLLGIHLTLFIIILQNFPTFRPLWYIPAIIAEGALFGVVCGILLDSNRARSHR